MPPKCFLCSARLSASDGADVTITLRDPSSGALTREQVVCCDTCADQIEARGAALLADVPQLRSITATYEDGHTVRHRRAPED